MLPLLRCPLGGRAARGGGRGGKDEEESDEDDGGAAKVPEPDDSGRGPLGDGWAGANWVLDEAEAPSPVVQV